ncbi:unnamed protein product [Bursaphelenchus xylophilus]|uniref:non-specific serine/threonine protein kinase n=1 Tax=Bursaphelenchus xylophilus TaxID=6326 RepID=A0A1I7S0I7_BURXY|nr:unnamed protein product [Bursaphelenchus xylophilus]CAG9132272.1 unnamed protein product [Bursaphelenchus xylophilus]
MNNDFDESTFANSGQIDELQSEIDHTNESDSAVRRKDKWDPNLDDLQFWELLGSGAYGDVFKAFNTKEEKSCAVKVLRIPMSMVDHQKREIRALGRLYHPNIVELHCASIVKRSILIMVMPLLWGLEDVIEEVKLAKAHNEFDCVSEATCRQLIKQLLEGIGFMHKKGIAHRDLKVANLLLDNHGVLKIADFGVCHEFEISDSEKTGELYTFCGSEVYMAPEVFFKFFDDNSIEEQPYSIRSESWSVGIILLELRVGQVPFWNILKQTNKYKMLEYSLKKFLKSPYFDFNILYPMGEHTERNFFSTEALTFLKKCLHCKAENRPVAKDLLATDPWINTPDSLGIHRIKREILKSEYLESVEIMDRYGNQESMAEFESISRKLPANRVIVTVMVKSPNTANQMRVIRFLVDLQKRSYSTRAIEKTARGKILPFCRRKIIGGHDYIRLTLKVVTACRRFSRTEDAKLVYEIFSLSGLSRSANSVTLEGMALVLINRSLRSTEKILQSPIPGVDVRSGEVSRKEFKIMRAKALRDLGIDRDDIPSQASSDTLLSSARSAVGSEVTGPSGPDLPEIEDSGTVHKKKLFKGMLPNRPFGFHRVLKFNHSNAPDKK